MQENEKRAPAAVGLHFLAQQTKSRLAVKVSRAGLRAIRSGSPWLFDQAIESVKPQGSRGDLAVIFDEDRQFAGIGLWDPDSPIRVKMLHVGKPKQIDGSWWIEKLQAALDLRRPLIADSQTTGFRWVHGENDALPGLVIDRYGESVVIKIYSAAWFCHLGDIILAIQKVAPAHRVTLRFSRAVELGDTCGLVDGDTLFGDAPMDPIMFRERGLTLEADVVYGHKTGHFLDQRDNRALIREIAQGCSVLDVFSSTGGFTLGAAAGGATSVHMVDVSAPALATAHRNLRHNHGLDEVARCRVSDTRGDAFAVLEKMVQDGLTFDIVIVDPPSFAQNQATVARALGSYERLAKLGMKLTAPGGTLMQASCSSRVDVYQLSEAVDAAARATGKNLHEFCRTSHPMDHPIGFEYGSYLKAIFYTVH